MIGAQLPVAVRPAPGLGPWLAPAALLTGLAGVVALRWWATRSGLDPLAVGAAFGLALVGLSVGRARPSWVDAGWRHAALAIAAGAGVGAGLVGLVVVGAAISAAPTPAALGRPFAPFPAWAMVTILVGVGEEALLRGRLFDAVRRPGGAALAVLVTTLAFALLHVPLYGWSVVPLDLAVGLAFAGLRVATGSVTAPASAHVVADLATWWLPG